MWNICVAHVNKLPLSLFSSSVQSRAAVALRRASSSVQRRSVLYVLCLLKSSNIVFIIKSVTCVMSCNGIVHYSLHEYFIHTGHCRKIQRACCQEVPPCPQAHGRAPEALHRGWVPHPHYPPGPPMEHVPSDLPASTPPSTSTSGRMALIPLVSGKFPFHIWLTPEWQQSIVSSIEVLFPCTLQCTVTCGGGVQARTVQCLVQGKPSPGCAHHLKPSMSQACNTNFCPQPEKKGTEAPT